MNETLWNPKIIFWVEKISQQNIYRLCCNINQTAAEQNQQQCIIGLQINPILLIVFIRDSSQQLPAVCKPKDMLNLNLLGGKNCICSKLIIESCQWNYHKSIYEYNFWTKTVSSSQRSRCKNLDSIWIYSILSQLYINNGSHVKKDVLLYCDFSNQSWYEVFFIYFWNIWELNPDTQFSS